ncbi:DSPTP1B [Symbiodinium natans]|uniref:DSPTP1B protein n=1 Tax=Symbiodinium natans TaxID=878477 RepID=A0A812PJ45_9DINO|nr:DSPTP1B [Symbiodinium natans]
MLQDLEFVVSNKVTRVINCAGRQVPNHWESIGVVYLTYYWVDAESQVVLDPRDVVSPRAQVVKSESFRFIEEALNAAESVLIHSVRGQSRSCCILGAYMMRKYSWGLRKTMEFLSFRRRIHEAWHRYLQQTCPEMLQQYEPKSRNSWQPCGRCSLVLCRCTFRTRPGTWGVEGICGGQARHELEDCVHAARGQEPDRV